MSDNTEMDAKETENEMELESDVFQNSLPQLIIDINIYFSFDYHYTYTFPPTQTQHFLLPTDLLSVEWEPYLGIPYSTPIMPQRLLVLLLRNKLIKRT